LPGILLDEVGVVTSRQVSRRKPDEVPQRRRCEMSLFVYVVVVIVLLMFVALSLSGLGEHH
jgi:hypothetical protein